MSNVRVEIVVSGQVQRVGYRNVVSMLAFKLGIKGKMSNDESDEHKVHIVCEGTKEKVREFLNAIKIQEFPIFVEKVEEKYSEPKNEFSSFERKLGSDFQKETFERADEGALYMMLLARETKDFKSQTKTGFDVLDKKYGVISEELQSFKQVMEELSKTLKEDRHSFKQLTEVIIKLAGKTS